MAPGWTLGRRLTEGAAFFADGSVNRAASTGQRQPGSVSPAAPVAAKLEGIATRLHRPRKHMTAPVPSG